MDDKSRKDLERLSGMAVRVAYVVICALIIALLAMIPVAMIAGVARFIVWCVVG